MKDIWQESYEIGRKTGSVVTPEEFAAMVDYPVEILVRTTYELNGGGRIDPPRRLVVECSPDAEPGVSRTMAKLLESRGWTARVEVDKVVKRKRGGADDGDQR